MRNLFRFARRDIFRPCLGDSPKQGRRFTTVVDHERRKGLCHQSPLRRWPPCRFQRVPLAPQHNTSPAKSLVDFGIQLYFIRTPSSRMFSIRSWHTRAPSLSVTAVAGIKSEKIGLGLIKAYINAFDQVSDLSREIFSKDTFVLETRACVVICEICFRMKLAICLSVVDELILIFFAFSKLSVRRLPTRPSWRCSLKTTLECSLMSITRMILTASSQTGPLAPPSSSLVWSPFPEELFLGAKESWNANWESFLVQHHSCNDIIPETTSFGSSVRFQFKLSVQNYFHNSRSKT